MFFRRCVVKYVKLCYYKICIVIKTDRKCSKAGDKHGAHRVFYLRWNMKFYALTTSVSDKTVTNEMLQTEYKAAQQIGKIRLGTERFYFRAVRKVYYIPYPAIYRYFRRVMLVPAKLCCGKGDFAVEHFVVCNAEKELAQIQLPGSHAAKVLMERMHSLAPDAIAGTPDSGPQTADIPSAGEEPAGEDGGK